MQSMGMCMIHLCAFWGTVYDNNTFPTLKEIFGRPDAAAYLKVHFIFNRIWCLRS